MVAGQKYRVLDPETGALDRSIFVDEQIYQDELEKVFGRSWLWVGHESLVPNPNDFFLIYMGEDPVILTRDAKGQLHAFLNMCRHRGNRVVRADDGNAKNFMCTYHGWTFSNEGKLVSVPGLQEAYYGELDVEHLGLVPVAQLDTYAGFVFATWAEDAPTLEAYLGDLRWYLDTRYNRTDHGIQLTGPAKWIIPANWKVPCDNAMGDMYHGFTTHISSLIVQERFQKSLGFRTPHQALTTPGQLQVHAGNGHGVMVNVREGGNQAEGEGAGRRANPATPRGQRALAYAAAKHEEAVRRLGEYRATRVSGGGSVFPNKFLGPNLAIPRGPYNMEVWTFVQHDKDAPEALAHDILRRATQNGANMPAGGFMQDDMSNWRNVTEGSRSLVGRRTQQNLSMGIRHEGKHPNLPGVGASQAACSETGQRGFYGRYQEFMNAESWADIHLDPITATFEGTATVKG